MQECACRSLAQFLEAAVMIQQVALYRAAAKRLVEMLAVNIDKQFAQGLELLHGNGVAVDERPRPAVRIDHPAQQALIIFVERLLLQPGTGLRQVGDLEFGTELGALCTASHELAAAALAEDQSECVDQDRFTRPGFASKHGHARFEFDLDPIDNCKIPHLQIHNHV